MPHARPCAIRRVSFADPALEVVPASLAAPEGCMQGIAHCPRTIEPTGVAINRCRNYLRLNGQALVVVEEPLAAHLVSRALIRVLVARTPTVEASLLVVEDAVKPRERGQGLIAVRFVPGHTVQ